MSYNRTRRGNGSNNNSNLNSSNSNRNNNFENFNYIGNNNMNLSGALENMSLSNNNSGRMRKIKFRNYANQTNFKFNTPAGNFGETQMVTTRKNGRKGSVPRIPFNNNRAATNNLNTPSLSHRVATAHKEIAAGINLPRKYTMNTAENYQNRKNLRKLVALSMSGNNNRVRRNVMNSYSKRTAANAAKAANIGRLDELNAVENDN